MPSPSFNLSSVLAQLGRFVLRLGFWLIAAVAIICLLMLSLGLLMLGLLRALITGQRPKPMMKFKFQNFTASQGTRFWPRESSDASAEETGSPQATRPLTGQHGPRRRIGADSEQIVDVEVREIPDQPPRT